MLIGITLLQILGPAMKEASHFTAAINTLCTVLVAVAALVTGLKIYNKWQLGHLAMTSVDWEIVMWFGSLMFFLIAKTFIHFILK